MRINFKWSYIFHTGFIFNLFLSIGFTKKGCIYKVSKIHVLLTSPDSAVFEWDQPTKIGAEDKVDGYAVSLSTNNIAALQWHNVKDMKKKIIWNDNDVTTNTYSKDDFKFLTCVDYKFSVQVKCVKTKKTVLSSGEGKVFKGYNSEPFKSVTFDVVQNNQLDIILDPSSVISLCRPEYHFEIYEHNKEVNSNCSSLECLKKVTEWKIVNQTKYTLTTTTTNGNMFQQCADYTAVIKLLDPEAKGTKQEVPFKFDNREENDTDWAINSFEINKTGPNWVYLSWLPPVNYSECVKSYKIIVYDKNEKQLNYTILKSEDLNFNVSSENGYMITPCTSYSFSLFMAGIRNVVNATINGTTSVVAPGEVSDLEVKNITTSSMTVVWKKPSYGLTCGVNYALSFTDKMGSYPVIRVDLDKTLYTKTDLKACVEYEIGIRTKGSEIDSHKVTINATVGSEVPGAVETFKTSEVGTSDVTLVWTRPAKYPDCVAYYNLSWYDTTEGSLVKTVKVDDPDENIYKVSDLQPCWNYTFTIYCGGSIGKSQLTNISTVLKEQVPGPVENVSITSGDFQLIAEWRPPTSAVHCVNNYIVRSNALNMTETISFDTADFDRGEINISHLKKDAFNTTKVLSDLIACIEYEVTITAASLSGGESVPVSVLQATLPHEFSEPLDGKSLTTDQTWSVLQWIVPYTNRNHCPLELFVVTCNQTEGGPSMVWNTTERDSKGYVQINATNLTPYTNYKCSAQAANSAGWSRWSKSLTFQTLQGVPSAPRNIHVLDKTSTTIKISWDAPSEVPGVLEEYNVTVHCSGPQYAVPEICVANITIVLYSVTLTGYAENVLLDRLLPYQECKITVAAETAAGYGPPSQPKSTLTLPSVSEVVRDLSVSVYYNESLLTWYPPCFSNGIISYFSIKLSGTREGYHPDREQIWNRSYESDKPDMKYTEHLLNLLPEYDYKVEVSVFVDSVKKTVPASFNFKSSAQIPEEPSLASLSILHPDPKATDTPSEKVKITLSSHLFSDKNGCIKYYAILVAEAGSLGPPQSGLLNNREGKPVWPSVRTWANATQGSAVLLYQATPPWWNPFQEGDESCAKDTFNVYCNGPLNPSTTYELRIRAFTSAGYRDSPPIPFSTEAAFPYSLMWKLFFCLFLSFAFVILIIYFVLRRSSWVSSVKKTNKVMQPNSEISDEIYFKEMSLKRFILYCNNILADDNLMKTEFQRLNALSGKIDSQYTVAQLPENKKKNRYINVLPYDSTRVILEDCAESDYINASYIKDHADKTVNYIACQAPKDDTCVEFWKMIYQCKVQSIVMLCNYTEFGKPKCYSYFPESNETLKFDDMTIICTDKRVFNSHIERTLSLTKEEQDVCRAVTHFHFVDWPDFGVPSEPEAMLNFCKSVSSVSVGDGMIVVHCSAGVGRTGTYIATDLLLRHIEVIKKINVFKTVLSLREQRASMVQTEVQYSYIYKCLKYALDHPAIYFKRKRSLFESKRKKQTRNNNRRDSKFSQASSISSR